MAVLMLSAGCHRPPAPGAADAPSRSSATPATAGATTAELDPTRLTAGPPRALGAGYLFTLVAPDAGSVAVAGSFNGWVPTRDLLRRHGDLWFGIVDVSLGRHRYRFLIDGTRWVIDPENPRRAKDDFGEIASLLVVMR